MLLNNKKMAVHSDYEVNWKNFKGFEDTGWIKIKPITILIGPNNSGKTSFLVPFLLMNQTLISRDSTSPIIIKGNVYDGGSFKELVTDGDQSKDLFLGFRYHLDPKPQRLKKVGAYPPGAFEVTIGTEADSSKLVVKKETIFDTHLREYCSITRNDEKKYKISGLSLNEKENEDLANTSPVNFLFTPNSILRSLIPDREKGKMPKFSDGLEDLLGVVSVNSSFAGEILAGLSYLGPLREGPHRSYEISNEVSRTVGQKGDKTANLLKQNWDKIQEDLNNWIRKFEFGEELTLKSLSNDENLYSICLKDSHSHNEINITNIGFGASQILPLIVQALVSREESLTIAEQPEIHLNPRLQGVLADLFAFMAKNDKRIIVETHSEHILLRLRTLVASKEIDPDHLAIYYIEKADGYSKIQKINIDANGSTTSTEWPKGFFGDTLRESLALASQQAKNRKA